MKAFYPPAVPLITVDPYFNIWSCADHLYDDVPRHWTSKKNGLTGLLAVDGTWYRFMGKIEQNLENYYPEPAVLEQTKLEITAVRTNYRFENEAVVLKVSFFTPLLLDDWKLLSRPVSYVTYEVESRDGKGHEICFYLDISSEAAVNESSQKVVFGRDARSVFCGRGEKGVLAESGDDRRIDWGFLHLAAPDHTYVIWDTAVKRQLTGREDEKYHRRAEELPDGMGDIKEPAGSGIFQPAGQNRPEMGYLDGKEYVVSAGYPSLGCYRSAGISQGKNVTGRICFAYDDIHSLEYFGRPVDAYWRKDGGSFDEMLDGAISGYEEVSRRAEVMEEQLKADALAVGGEYYLLLCLAYRQVIAAHKLAWDGKDALFLSKECFSNGCIGTVDVTYPSIPLFLKYSPDLLKGMLTPVFRYAAGNDWKYPFAPHDVGQYPLANGQVYGYDKKTRVMKFEEQMPVEECGNMLLCTAALCKWTGSYEYAAEHRDQLAMWADYLKETGWNPENQLCTDDFAGHLAHNCNLSIKGILGLAAWGEMLKELGEAESGKEYRDLAEAWAKEWERAAFAGDHYRLTFDNPESWSLKYNLIWDKLLGLNVFDEKIAETEVAFYKKKIGPNGIPLDSRCDYTKSDWQMWTTVLTGDKEYRDLVIHSMVHALSVMEQRVPFTDWYYTDPVKKCYFQNRSVQGGLFVCLL